MELTVMTYNIQHGVDHARRLREPGASDVDLIDLDRFALTIRDYQPDILSINEVRDVSFAPGFSAQARLLARALDMPYYFFAQTLEEGERGPYGNALLSRYPFASIEKVMIPDPPVKKPGGHYERRCLIQADLRIGHKPLRVISTHFGLEPEEAESAVRTVLSVTDPAIPTVLMGDFNLTPESPLLDPLRRIYRDSAVLLPPGVMTFPSDKPEMKIDYILSCGPAVFTHAQVPERVVSDHFPYVAKIEV